MAYVYGDSTPFPYDVDFIELIRAVVQCGATLLASQQAITQSTARIAAADQTRKSERARMDRISEAVRQSMGAYVSSGPERQTRAAARIVDTARGVVEGELASIESTAEAEFARHRGAIESARGDGFRALEAFLRKHDVPGSEVALRLAAGAEAYAADAVVTTPFGVEAKFELVVPSAHAWNRPLKVGEIASGTEVHVPQESGFFSKRIDLKPVKLDRLYVSEVTASSNGSQMVLRKGAQSGGGYQLEVLSDVTHRAILRELDDEGAIKEGAQPLSLTDDDGDRVFRLWNSILATTEDLLKRRASMVRATFDGHPLLELDEPRGLVQRMVDTLAPTVREIERRSGTPRELVLRRDLGEGRRQESYIKKSELLELVSPLPADLRKVFNPFELEVQRVSLPPAARPEAVEISAELVLEESSGDRRPS